jgi:hypothetical protein
MAAKIQYGHHVLKVSEYLGISAVVITTTVWNSTNSLYYTNLYSVLQIQDGSQNPRWPPNIIFFRILKFFSCSHYRSVWNSTTYIWLQLITHTFWPFHLSEKAKISTFNVYDAFLQDWTYPYGYSPERAFLLKKNCVD